MNHGFGQAQTICAIWAAVTNGASAVGVSRNPSATRRTELTSRGTEVLGVIKSGEAPTTHNPNGIVPASPRLARQRLPWVRMLHSWKTPTGFCRILETTVAHEEGLNRVAVG